MIRELVFRRTDIPGGRRHDFARGEYFFDADVPLGSVLKFTTPKFGDDYTIAKLTVDVVPTPAAVLPVISGLFAAAGRREEQEAEEA